MKNIIILLFCLFSYSAFANVTVDVISAEYPVEDYLNRKTLCLTVVRVPQTGDLLGVVEDIGDCFYARAAKKSRNNKIKLPLNKLAKITDPEMKEHLQRMDTQLKFYFSDGE